jgi:hypothetical protein
VHLCPDFACIPGKLVVRRYIIQTRGKQIALQKCANTSLIIIQCEPADKPGSVVGNHSSKDRCHQRPQATYPEARGATVHSLRNAASLFGLAPGGVYLSRDVLPPARCALTAPFHPYRDSRANPGFLRRLFSVALSVGSRLPGVTWHPARRSPDFPPACEHASDCLAGSPPQYRGNGAPTRDFRAVPASRRGA